jgi:hypothetical protein
MELMLAGFSHGLLSSDENFLDYISQSSDIENIAVLEMSVMALIISYIYEDLTAVYNATDIGKANDGDLDALGRMFFSRMPASKAVTDITYSIDTPLGAPILIPQGSKVSDENRNVVFATVEDATLLAGDTEVTVGAECTEAGTAGNLPADSLTHMVDSISEINDVNNEVGCYGGKPQESDESYRLRLFNWKYILERGTYDAVIQGITSVSSVEGYYIDRYWDGYGSTKIIIDPPLQITIDSVTSALEHWKAVDEPYRIVGVETVPIDVSCVINISLDETIAAMDTTKQSTKTKVEQYIRIYIDGGLNRDGTEKEPLGIGKDFIPFKCGVYLSEQIPEIKDVTFNYPAAPITIQSHQKASANTLDVVVV